jgi:hypothetical protein
MKTTLKIASTATILLSVVIGSSVISGNQVRAETSELVGEFRPPPLGTFYEYNNFTSKVSTIADIYFTHKRDSSKKKGMKKFTSMLVDIPIGGSRVREHEVLHSQFWPLKIGNKVEMEVDMGQHILYVEMEVAATESVIVPAGEFFTYKVVQKHVIAGNNYEAIQTYWYSPKLAVAVKSEFRVTEGKHYGLTENSVLKNVTYRSPRIGNFHEEGASMVGGGSTADAAPKSSGMRAKLVELKKMFDDGLMSADDYKAKKKDVLEKF